MDTIEEWQILYTAVRNAEKEYFADEWLGNPALNDLATLSVEALLFKMRYSGLLS